jgi:hypothetical protein
MPVVDKIIAMLFVVWRRQFVTLAKLKYGRIPILQQNLSTAAFPFLNWRVTKCFVRFCSDTYIQIKIREWYGI